MGYDPYHPILTRPSRPQYKALQTDWAVYIYNSAIAIYICLYVINCLSSESSVTQCKQFIGQCNSISDGIFLSYDDNSPSWVDYLAQRRDFPFNTSISRISCSKHFLVIKSPEMNLLKKESLPGFATSPWIFALCKCPKMVASFFCCF